MQVTIRAFIRKVTKRENRILNELQLINNSVSSQTGKGGGGHFRWSTCGSATCGCKLYNVRLHCPSFLICQDEGQLLEFPVLHKLKGMNRKSFWTKTGKLKLCLIKHKLWWSLRI